MTRTISFIIGIAVVALVVVPAALGAERQPGLYSGANQRSIVTSVSNQPDAVQFFYAHERATMSRGSNEPAIVSKNTPESPAVRAEWLRSEGLNKLYGLGEFAPTMVNECVVES